MSYKCVVDDKVSFKYDQYEGTGTVKFVGSLLPLKQGRWVGIERNMEIKDETPFPDGYNGKLGDMKYFTLTKKNRGIFVPYDCVQLMHEHSFDDKNLSQQTELQEIVNYSLNNDDDDHKIETDIDQQLKLQKAQQLLEASLLLLQNGILYGRSIDKIHLQNHCDQAWQFLNKKYPPSISPMARNDNNNNNNDQDEEKFVTFQSDSVKDNISIEQKKMILTDFFNRYSDATNWKMAGKESYGVESYTLKLDKERTINVRMSFLYSMLLYLIQITGSNKRCISHGAILIMPKKQQIETLSAEFQLILKTLQHNDDDGLYQYVYQYIVELFNNFSKQIKPYSGKRIQINDQDYKENNDESNNDDDSTKMMTSMFKLKALVTKK